MALTDIFALSLFTLLLLALLVIHLRRQTGSTPEPKEWTLSLPGGGSIAITLRRGAGRWHWPLNGPQTVMAAVLAFYALTRLIGLSDYPIYFFTDEAIQTNLAAELVAHNFQGHDGVLLPTYFFNVDKFSLSTSVYAQVLPTLLFGRSVLVTRGTAALLTILAAWWVSASLRDVFKTRIWWAGALVLGMLPAWFLHSRTAFETSLMASFYAGFLYFYLRYRQGETRFLYPAIVCGALAFYSYNPGRVVVVFTALLWLLTDLRYHWAQKAVRWNAVGLTALTALPFVRFVLTHPDSQQAQLATLASYWIKPIPLIEKLSLYAAEYARGLSIGYWFSPDPGDITRHLMDGHAHIFGALLPFFLLGVILAIINGREPAQRGLLAALLAAPTGAAIVQIGVTRALVFLIPAALLITLGIDTFLRVLESWRMPRWALTGSLLIMLLGTNMALLTDALVNGPYWEQDYGLTGMQYGGEQIFTAVRDHMRAHPEEHLIISPTWANGTDVLASFFFPVDPLPFDFASIRNFEFNYIPDLIGSTFVLPRDEFQRVMESNKFTNVRIENILPYPDGRGGFYFLKLDYVDGIEQILAEEYAARRELISDEVSIDGEIVTVRASLLDIGIIQSAFDGDPETVARTLQANPFILELDFLKARTFNGLTLQIGSTTVHVIVILTPSDGGEPVTEEHIGEGSVANPNVSIIFSQPVKTDKISITVEDLAQGEPGNVHIWEVHLEQADE